MADVVEIIKGLESCLREDISDYKCEQCPYLKETNCLIKIKRDAFELLKIRQEQIRKKTDRIKKLNKRNKELRDWIDYQNKVISYLEEELQKERWEVRT